MNIVKIFCEKNNINYSHLNKTQKDIIEKLLPIFNNYGLLKFLLINDIEDHYDFMVFLENDKQSSYITLISDGRLLFRYIEIGKLPNPKLDWRSFDDNIYSDIEKLFNLIQQ